MRRGLRFLLAGTVSAAAKFGRMAGLELWLTSGTSVQIRVDDIQAELNALKERRGRFSGEYVDLTGPALGVVRVDAIVAALIR
jgi:hypothetical protein